MGTLILTLAITVLGPVLGALMPVAGRWLLKRFTEANSPEAVMDAADQRVQGEVQAVALAKSQEELNDAKQDINADFDRDLNRLRMREQEVRDRK